MGCSRRSRETDAVRHLEALGGTDDGARGIANGHGPHENGNTVAIAMMKIEMGFPVLAILDGRRKRAVGGANDAAVLVGVNQNFVATDSAHDFVAQIPADALGPGIPKKNSSIPVNQIHANRKRIQHCSTNFRVIKR